MKANILSALILLGAAPIALAQTMVPTTKTLDRSQAVEVQVNLPAPADETHVLPAPKVEITYISPVMADNPGRVEILGNNLNMVREAKVAGVTVPIVFNNGHRMLITPGDQVPGFGNLELIRIGGTLDAKIEFTPCLSAEWRGGRARFMLHPDAEGWYLIEYSFRRLDTPMSTPGIYYGSLLDPSGQCGVLYSGLTPNHEALSFPWMNVPNWAGPAVVGPMHVQALCLVGEEVCYSNMVTLQPRL